MEVSACRPARAKIFVLLIPVLLIGVGGASFVYAAEPLSPESTMTKSVKASNKDHVMLIAHRGAPSGNPEHSLASYRRVVSQGSIFLEADVVPSKDGVLFVTHDNNLKRTTGRNITITKNKAKRLDKVKLKNGEKLLRLSELFDAFGKDVFYVIETKSAYVPDGRSRVMDKKLVRLIGKYGLARRVMIQSQSMDSLRTIHAKLKSAPYMYITEKDPKSKLVKKSNHCRASSMWSQSHMPKRQKPS
jgi:glycerophosphoryl diester phosphodiesterase